MVLKSIPYFKLKQEFVTLNIPFEMYLFANLTLLEMH